MAIHIYMSVGQLQADGRVIDKSTGSETKVMRYRGEATVGDDPVGFKRDMEKKGYIVEIYPSVVGEEVERPYGNSIQKSFEYNLGEV